MAAGRSSQAGFGCVAPSNLDSRFYNIGLEGLANHHCRQLSGDNVPTIIGFTAINTPQSLSDRESSHVPRNELSNSVKPSQRKKQKLSFKPVSTIQRAPRPREPRQSRGSQMPGKQEIGGLSEVFSITKPSRLNRLEPIKANKTRKTGESTVSPEPYDLGQTYQAECPWENARSPTSNAENKNELVHQDSPNLHLTSSFTFQDGSRQRKDCYPEAGFQDRNSEQQNPLQDDGSALLDSSPQDSEELSSLTMHQNVNNNESPRSALGLQPNREDTLHICTETTKKEFNQSEDPNFDEDDSDEFPLSSDEFPLNSENFPLDVEDFRSDSRDNFPLKIDDATSSIDECFSWSDADLEEMIQLTDASHELGSSGYNPAFEGTTNEPWLVDSNEDIDMLCSMYASDSPKSTSYKDGNESFDIAMNRVDAVSSSPHLDFTSRSNDTCFIVPTENAKIHDIDSHHHLEDNYEDGQLENELSRLTTTAHSGLQDTSSPATSITPNDGVQPVSRIAVTFPKQSSPSKQKGDIPHLVPFDTQGKPIPFVRPPFTKLIRDRSPIVGLSCRMVLRICFRLGEALNAAAIASRSNVDTIIELYANVVASKREMGSFKQTFTFADIFMHERPPFLHGTYALWRGVELWDHDSRAFLGENNGGKMARVIGRINRNEEKTGWIMAIMNIWQVDWEDIGIAKGIVCL